MKFAIIKILFIVFIISLCISIISNTSSKTKTATSLQTESQSGVGVSANYKITLSSLIAKSKKKSESNSEITPIAKVTDIDKLLQPSQVTEPRKILFKGWLKYFKYKEKKVNEKPKQFFQNLLYQKDIRKRKSDKNSNVNIIIF